MHLSLRAPFNMLGVVHYASYIYEISMLCPEDPSSWCTKDTGEISPTPAQYR